MSRYLHPSLGCHQCRKWNFCTSRLEVGIQASDARGQAEAVSSTATSGKASKPGQTRKASLCNRRASAHLYNFVWLPGHGQASAWPPQALCQHDNQNKVGQGAEL